MTNQKILLKNKNSTKLFNKAKLLNKKIILCHGTFDVLHVGHINHFKEAAKLADILIVSVTSDKYVLKGPGRPINSLNKRLKILESLEFIDYVIESNSPTAISILNFIKPDFYCKGPDYKNNNNDVTGKIKDEIKVIKSIKGKIVYTAGMTMSSSKIINEFSENLSSHQKKFLKNIKQNSSSEKIIKKIEQMKNINILVIGETIIDEYVFCEAVGKSGKESVLVIKEKNKERYVGGAAQIAKHLSGFSKKISFLSLLGEEKEDINFIKKNIDKNIKNFFYTKPKSPTIRKMRYVDKINQNKLMGVYNLNDELIPKSLESKIISKIKKIINKYDLVVVADYGHGFITKKIGKLLCLKSNILALNAQINSSNIGYQNFYKYNNFDTLVINEAELRHEFRDRESKKEILAKKLIKILKLKNIIVTCGKDGAIIVSNNYKALSAPAFANKVVDKVGSGDAMLSMISLCRFVKMNNEEIMLVSSLAAAQSVESMGNSKSIDKNELNKSINYILK